MTEDNLRRALRDEADRVEAGEDSWHRLQSRLTMRFAERSPARTMLRPAITIVVFAALLGGVLVVARGDQHRAMSSAHGGRPIFPNRIVAMTDQGQPVVLGARTGRMLVTYESQSYAQGTQIAVAPDGRDFYFAEGDGNKSCVDHSITRFPLTGGPDHPGAQIADEATEPAISPDGRYLAFYRCFGSGVAPPGTARAAQLELRDLRMGTYVVAALPARHDDVFGERLVFDADSEHLVYELAPTTSAPADTSGSLHRVALIKGEGISGVPFDVAPAALRGALGSTGAYLLANGNVVMAARPRNPADPGVFSSRRLFSIKRPGPVVSDASGRHILVVAGHTLYRWSRGDKQPTKIRDGIITAAWIPEAPVISHRTLASRINPAVVHPRDPVLFRTPESLVGSGVSEVRRASGTLELERSHRGEWRHIRDVEVFSVALASRPDSTQETFTVPDLSPGRYRVCAAVTVATAERSRLGKTCRPLSVLADTGGSSG